MLHPFLDFLFEKCCASIWTLERKAHVLFLKAPAVVPTQTDEKDENDRSGSKENVPLQKEKRKIKKEKGKEIAQLVYTYTMRLTKAAFCSSWLKVILKHSIRWGISEQQPCSTRRSEKEQGRGTGSTR